MNVKKYILGTGLALLTGSVMTSCENFLETTPKDFIAPENFYNNESETDQALAGAYKVLNTLYSDAFKAKMFATTDEVVYARLGGYALLEKIHNSSTPDINNCWNNLYKGVYYANSVLENIDKVKDISETKRNSLRSEALFLRAFYYYHIVVMWGDVPLRLEAISSPVGTACAKTSSLDVYKQIIEDLKYAVENLYPYEEQKGAPVRICKEGAIGFLARVYLSLAGEPLKKTEYYAEARNLLLPLVESQKIKLIPDYTQIWKNIAGDLYDHENKEILFDVEFTAATMTYYIYGGWGANASPAAPASDNVAAGYNLDWFKVCYKLWEAYQSDTDDVRYSWNICDYKIDGNGNRVLKPEYLPDGSNVIERNPGKFRRDYETVLPRDKNANGHNFPILRYSDMLLMLAEAENEVNGPTEIAYDALDQVRSRAGAFLFADKYPNMTPDEFREVIKEERSRELCFESTTRYYDLLRWGDLKDRFAELAIGYTSYGKTEIANRLYGSFKEHMLLLPIPMDEMQLNPLIKENNPGW